MDNFAVLNIKKYKDLGGIGMHIDRTSKDPNANRALEEELHVLLGKHVDRSKSNLNEYLLETMHLSLHSAVKNRIREGYTVKKAIRKDAVKALGVIMTGSPGPMKEIESDPNKFDKWIDENFSFACEEFGKENIVRFTLHRDEKTPHIHCVVVPITKDGRLSASHWADGKIKLRALQDRYAEKMKYFGLKRGISTELTGHTHKETKEYYRELNISQASIQEQTKNINTLNPLKREKGKAELECVKSELEVLRQENARLKQDLSFSRKTSQSLKKDHLKSDLEAVKKSVNLIQHVSAMGYCLNKVKSSRTWAVMEKEGDKLLIKNSPNQQGHWVYKSLVDNRDKGSIVDLMLNRGHSYEDIRGLRSVHLDKGVLEVQKSLGGELQDLSAQKELAGEELKKYSYATSHYLEARGISKSTYASYQGHSLGAGFEEVLDGDSKKSPKAVFGLYQNIGSQGNGTLCSTIAYQFGKTESGEAESKQYFQKGLSRGLVVLNNPEVKVEKIIVTESPIDALSYKQIHQEKDSTMYLATCGSLTSSIKKDLGNVFEEAKANQQEVVLAFDKDKEGQKMQSAVHRIAEEKGVVTKSVFPEIGKDWSETLLLKNSAEEQARLRQFQKDLAESGQELQLRKKKRQGHQVLGMSIDF